MSQPEDVVAELRAHAARHAAEARRIEALPTGGRASTSVGEIAVSDSGAITTLTLTEKVTRYSPTEASDRLWRLYQDAVADAARANLFATQGELSGLVDAPEAALRDEQVAEDAPLPGSEDEAEIGAPGDRPVALTDLTVDHSLPAGAHAGSSPAELVDAFAREVDELWAQATAAAQEWRQLRGRGASPAQHPVATAVVDGAGAPIELRLTSLAAGATPEQLTEHLLAALRQATHDVDQAAQAVWRRGHAPGTARDHYPLRDNPEGDRD